MKVLLTASEVVPYAKTGGLADVVGVLADELSLAGMDVMLVMPLYKGIKETFYPVQTASPIDVHMGNIVEKADLFELERQSGVRVVFVGNDLYFQRDELYATSSREYPDNDRRFAFFSKAVLDAALALDFIPDVLHVNDWQTALSVVYLKTNYRWAMPTTSMLLTIHNLGYQGLFPPESMRTIGLPYEFYTPSIMEFYGKVNFLKTGLIFSDAINTVSEQYAREILLPEFGFGLNGVLFNRRHAISGITNGIDQNYWNPSSDEHLPSSYSADNIEGKGECRKALLQESGFVQGPAPVAGMVGRLSSQKGLGLLIDSFPAIVSFGLRVVVLGKGEEAIQNKLLALEKQYPKNLCVKLEFNEPLAHLIYAGSDFFMMPSLYEPCGLTQMISMRYGTPPVVRATGGLVDTVDDVSGTDGTGFLFADKTAAAFSGSIRSAITAMGDARQWRALIMRCMGRDFSWKRSAQRYIDLYREIKEDMRA